MAEVRKLLCILDRKGQLCPEASRDENKALSQIMAVLQIVANLSGTCTALGRQRQEIWRSLWSTEQRESGLHSESLLQKAPNTSYREKPSSLCCCLVGDKASKLSSVWPGTHHEDQVGIKLTEIYLPLPPPFWVLGSTMWAPMPGPVLVFPATLFCIPVIFCTPKIL